MLHSDKELIIHLSPGDKIKLCRDKPSNDNAILWRVFWQSLRTSYHFANLWQYPSPKGHYAAELIDEMGTVIAQIPLQSTTLCNAALEIVETKVCF